MKHLKRHVISQYRACRATEARVLLIYASLPTMKNPINGLFNEAAEAMYGLRRTQLDDLRDKVLASGKRKTDAELPVEVVFLLDAFDELKPGFAKNLWDSNELGQCGHSPKLIITCRSEVTQRDGYTQLFTPKARPDAFSELVMASFENRFREYISNLAALGVAHAFVRRFPGDFKPYGLCMLHMLHGRSNPVLHREVACQCVPQDNDPPEARAHQRADGKRAPRPRPVAEVPGPVCEPVRRVWGDR